MKLLGRYLPVFAIALAFGQAATAQDIGAAIKACRAEPDDSRRLACYDRAAGRAQPAVAAPPASTAAAPAAVTTAVPAEARAAPAEDRFGRERALENAEADRKEEEARSLGKLEATVSGIAIRAADGLMTITLDNGQVWRQNRPDAQFRLKNGDPVLIQPASMKSYILSGPSKRSTRVTRVE